MLIRVCKTVSNQKFTGVRVRWKLSGTDVRSCVDDFQDCEHLVRDDILPIHYPEFEQLNSSVTLDDFASDDVSC